MNAAAASSIQFYVTLFSNSSIEIYKENTLAAFTIKLAIKLLNYTENWEVGICEVTFPPRLLGTGVAMTTVGNSHVLVYCNEISPQYIGSDMVRCLRTFIFRLQIAKVYSTRFITCLSNRGNFMRLESSFC